MVIISDMNLRGNAFYNYIVIPIEFLHDSIVILVTYIYR